MFNPQIFSLLFPALGQTLYMVIAAMLITILFGLPLGIILVLTAPNHLWANPAIHRLSTAFVNITRSFPFIILMIAMMPFTRLLVGTAIGTNAAIIPLAFAAIPFYARIVESSLLEVPKGIVEAGLSMGASTKQIIFKFLLPEALPSLVHGIVLTLINLIGYSAMAGTIGGGGIGDLAIRYGYQRFKIDIMIATIITLILLVQLVQAIGNKLTRYLLTNRK